MEERVFMYSASFSSKTCTDATTLVSESCQQWS